MTRRLPQERPARVEIQLVDGSNRKGEVGVNRGDDASPYTREELHGKFLDLTSRVWPPAHGERVLEATLALAAGLTGMADWTGLLRLAPRAC
jgi:2-methylcitrate dehydratase PrpD